MSARRDDMRELVNLRIAGDDGLDQAISEFAMTHGEDVKDVSIEVDADAEARLEDLAFERHAMDVG